MKVVFDSNVILSAFLTEGLSHKVFYLGIVKYEPVISNWILSEVERVLVNKFKVQKTIIKEVLTFLKENFITLEPAGKPPNTCKDKDDNNILHLADYSKSELIITGDTGLLSLKSYKNTKILNPREFFEKYLT